MPPRKSRAATPKRKETLGQVDQQIDDICKALEGGVCETCAKVEPKVSSPCPHNELSTTQHATLIRELRQFLRLRSQLESAAPVDEAKLASSEVYQRQCRAIASAVAPCDQCSAAVLKVLKVSHA
jgi:hypothetical protein